ncbi:hypothetical protein J8J27_23300, partial [Mycobacterium tuberculosis]|nr:hypothetical protein [Mycobacterium tuberculosis]
VEGFTADQTAAILGVDRQELSGLIDTAGRQIGAQVTSSVLIIEDEPIIAMDLEALVAGLGLAVEAERSGEGADIAAQGNFGKPEGAVGAPVDEVDLAFVHRQALDGEALARGRTGGRGDAPGAVENEPQ